MEDSGPSPVRPRVREKWKLAGSQAVVIAVSEVVDSTPREWFESMSSGESSGTETGLEGSEYCDMVMFRFNLLGSQFSGF